MFSVRLSGVLACKVAFIVANSYLRFLASDCSCTTIAHSQCTVLTGEGFCVRDEFSVVLAGDSSTIVVHGAVTSSLADQHFMLLLHARLVLAKTLLHKARQSRGLCQAHAAPPTSAL